MGAHERAHESADECIQRGPKRRRVASQTPITRAHDHKTKRKPPPKAASGHNVIDLTGDDDDGNATAPLVPLLPATTHAPLRSSHSANPTAPAFAQDQVLSEIRDAYGTGHTVHASQYASMKGAKAASQHIAAEKLSAKKQRDRQEKRPARYRTYPPQSFLEKWQRATSQRMFVIDRKRQDVDGVPEEIVEVAGSTGNIYTVTINRRPSCTCPDHYNGNQCKHIIYVLYRVLKAPDPLYYQLAFLADELRSIFSRSPLAAVDASEQSSNRKPVEDNDCPVCFEGMDEDSEELVWCRASCGNNLHRACFEQWASSQHSSEVRCVFCRAPWQGDNASVSKAKQLRDQGRVNAEGYVNVARELGMSTERDYSTYHQFWVRQQRRNGYI